MKNSEIFACVSALCLLDGCSTGLSDDAVARTPASPEDAGGEVKPSEDAGSEVKPPENELDAPLIRGNVSSTFTMGDSKNCQPLGFPLTFFLTGVFGTDAIVEETATPVSDTQCLHEQVLAARADAWASLAYGVFCGGGGDTRLCGTQATRICSVDMLLQWAEDRTESVASSDPFFAFDYVVPPLEKPARIALYRRTLKEVTTLLAESEAVLAEGTARTQSCPDEDLQEIRAKYMQSFALRQQISDRLDRLNGE